VYDWEVLRCGGYLWWTRRLRRMLEVFDYIRLDHFRGYAAYWEVPPRRGDRSEWQMGTGARRGAV
jgi:4-alpha-glucanotransferase